jgi:hypothetical protein
VTQPYDAGYLKERGIKHMSFQAYLRREQNKLREAGLKLDGVQVLTDPVRACMQRSGYGAEAG